MKREKGGKEKGTNFIKVEGSVWAWALKKKGGGGRGEKKEGSLLAPLR